MNNTPFELSTLSQDGFFAEVRRQPEGAYCVFTWRLDRRGKTRGWRELFDLPQTEALTLAQRHVTQASYGPRRVMQ